jgi:hypothetical protein
MSSNVKDIILYPVRILTEAPVIKDIDACTRLSVESILSGGRGKHLKPGSRIGLTAGSRGIANYGAIMKTIVRVLQEKGFHPFIFSAMGSHGRGEPEGQREVLDSLGITSEEMNCEVHCSGEVVLVKELSAFGRTLPVYCAAEAMEADGIIAVNRIKPHTSFRGDYESGLLKMIAVGLGRAPGASVFHGLGAGLLGEALTLIGGCLAAAAPVIGGIGVLENANEQTAFIEGIPVENLLEREKELLITARQLMPRLPLRKADLCIVGEMGKNFSGTGMDTNIIGRMRIQDVAEPSEPRLTYIGVLRISEPSHGNATGIGLADFTTQRLVDDIDRNATYLNCLTSGFVTRAAIPMVFPTDFDLIQGALTALKCDEVSSLRMIAIRNTLHIDHFWVTEAIFREMEKLDTVESAGAPAAITFDHDGNWLLLR